MKKRKQESIRRRSGAALLAFVVGSVPACPSALVAAGAAALTASAQAAENPCAPQKKKAANPCGPSTPCAPKKKSAPPAPKNPCAPKNDHKT